MSNLAKSNDPLSITRDLLQARVLAKLFTEETHGIVLKGGLAMRLLHENSRATNDIDLDASKDISMNAIQAQLRKAIKQASSGLLENIKITEPKQTDTTMRWKVSGIDPKTKLNLHMTVEVSHRNYFTDNDIVKSQIPESKSFAKVYKSEILALNKIDALLNPSRNAPRDVLDLYMLITAHAKPPKEELKAWLDKYDFDVFQELWFKIEEMDENRFNAEVLPSLGPCKRLAEFSDWDNVRMIVATNIESWIKEIQEEEINNIQLSSKSICKKLNKQPSHNISLKYN